jgi:Phage major capsid protein E
MEQTLFVEQVRENFEVAVTDIVNRLNDTTNPNVLSYQHRRFLTKRFAPNMKWESLAVSANVVGADVIAMDSSLPLKKRDAISKASGDIPKMGIELAIREKELTDLDILAAMRGQEDEILLRIFQDTPRVIQAVFETLEYMFLKGLSTGVATITDTVNTGLEIDVDYGYIAANKFKALTAAWSGSATPLTDLKQLTEKARKDGNRITTFMMDEATFLQMASKDEVKNLWAAQNNFFGATVPIPTLNQVNQAARTASLGWQIEIIDRSVTFEKNGNKTPLVPWATGQVIGRTTDNLGTLTWGQLAEMNHPVENVNYQRADDFILVSKYRLNRPSLAEFTSSQALVLPVINGVSAIYKLDTTTT